MYSLLETKHWTQINADWLRYPEKSLTGTPDVFKPCGLLRVNLGQQIDGGNFLTNHINYIETRKSGGIKTSTFRHGEAALNETWINAIAETIQRKSVLLTVWRISPYYLINILAASSTAKHCVWSPLRKNMIWPKN